MVICKRDWGDCLLYDCAILLNREQTADVRNQRIEKEWL